MDRPEEAIREFMKNDARKLAASCEGSIENWFLENYKSLGFEKIIRKQWNKTPDFIMLKGGKEVKVEIEFLSSDFIKHKHRNSEVDVVVCCTEDIKLEAVKTIPLDHIFINYWKEIYPSIDPLGYEPTSDDLRRIVNVWDKKKQEEQKQ